MIILLIKTINKIVHSCNLLRISFFKRSVKEDVVAAGFMFELTLFQVYLFIYVCMYVSISPITSIEL